MATKPRLTAQRKRRREIRELIRDARMSAKTYREEGCRMIWQVDNAQLLDDLAKVAELYLKGGDAKCR